MRSRILLLVIALTAGFGLSDARGQFRPGRPRVAPQVAATAQVLFRAPEKMRVDDDLDVGMGEYQPIVAPARRNMPQGKVTSLLFACNTDERKFEIKGTLEIYSGTPRTNTFLGMYGIPIEIDETDVKTALTGRVVTKAYYLPADAVDMLGENSLKTIASINGEEEKPAETLASEKGAVLAVLRLTAVDAGIPGGIFPKVKDFSVLEERKTVKYVEAASEPKAPVDTQ